MLRDIARRANVSHVAVSRVLNGRYQGEVSQARADQILRLAREMGYVPHHAARSLRTGKTGIVLLVSDHVLNRSEVKRLRAFEAALSRRGVGLLVQWLVGMNDDERLENLARFCTMADGMIVFGCCVRDEQRSQAIMRNAPPVIWPTGPFSGTVGDYARVNWSQSWREIGSYFQRWGHSRIGLYLVNIPTVGKKAVSRKIAGVMTSLKVQAECRFLEGPFDDWRQYELGVEIAREWLASEAGIRPTAIYCEGDSMALSLMEVVRAEGLRIPEDLAVMGGGDSDFREWLRPALTVLTHSEDDLAELAVTDLIRRIEKGERSPGTGACVGVIPQTIIAGGSCGETVSSRPKDKIEPPISCGAAAKLARALDRGRKRGLA
ncbi:MAG: LacI family DNA-binding transcriptional regulator [Kiritimatiellae bacterium]|nr:LacI family DNA-binding transcriptional regulator [Kiritimatiellia bacterium]